MRKLVGVLLLVGALTFGASYATTIALAGQGNGCCGQCDVSGGGTCGACQR